MQSNSLTTEFPTVLAKDLAMRLSSRRGADGIAELIERLRPYWEKLQAVWPPTDQETGAAALGQALMNAAKGGDSPDLVTKEIRLRHTGADNGGGDSAVCANIVRSLIEALCDGNTQQAYQAALAISAASPAHTWNDVGFLINLALARLHIERSEFELAAAAAKRNLDQFICPTSQYMLYRSLAAKAQSGAPVVGSEIFIGGLSERFCSEPFDTLATGTGRLGGAPSFFACACPGTAPYPLAFSEPNATRERLWNGEEIQEIRRSILDGDFTYCSRKVCPYIVHGTLPKRAEIIDPRLRDIIDNRRVVLDTPPVKVTLGHDPSCNLACPSCRTKLMVLKNEARAAFDDASRNVLLPLLADAPVTLILQQTAILLDPSITETYSIALMQIDMLS
ncbi:MAG: hypothetical protein HYS06_10715 [Methylocystis sp.]|nr:hypothetical protein [Methylocystis sp.]